MGIDVKQGLLDSQASSVKTMTKTQVSAYKKALEQLTSFTLDASLKGEAYDNAKAYAAGPMLSLLTGAQLYTEKVAEVAQKIADKYSSEVGEDLKEDDLKALIKTKEAHKQFLLKQLNMNDGMDSESVHTRNSLNQGISNVDTALTELREKLTKLQNFSATSDSVRSELTTLGEALVTGYGQVSGDIQGFVENHTFPKRSVQQWQKVISEKIKETYENKHAISSKTKKTGPVEELANTSIQTVAEEGLKFIIDRLTKSEVSTTSYTSLTRSGNGYFHNINLSFNSKQYIDDIWEFFIKDSIRSVTIKNLEIPILGSSVKFELSGVGSAFLALDFFNNLSEENAGRATTHTIATATMSTIGFAGATMAVEASSAGAAALIASNPVGWTVAAGIGAGMLANWAYESNFMGIKDSANDIGDSLNKTYEDVGNAISSGWESIQKGFGW